MALEIKQGLKTTQKISLSAELKHSITILTLGRFELEKLIIDELEKNPCLVGVAKQEENNQLHYEELKRALQNSYNQNDYMERYNDIKSNEEISSNDQKREFADTSSTNSIHSHIENQIAVMRLSSYEKECIYTILQYIDDTGFLNTDIKTISENHDIHYDDVKIDTEILVRNFCTKNNLYYTIIRPTAVIGKGSVWVTEPLKRMDTKLGLKLIDHGKQPACLIDAENLANGIFLCMTKEAAHNQTFFFMDDWEVSWKQYFTDLGVMKGKKISNSIPFTLAFLLASIAEILFPLFGKNPPLAKKSAIATGTNRLVSTEKAKTLLGWTSKISYPISMQRIKESLN